MTAAYWDRDASLRGHYPHHGWFKCPQCQAGFWIQGQVSYCCNPKCSNPTLIQAHEFDKREEMEVPEW